MKRIIICLVLIMVCAGATIAQDTGSKAPQKPRISNGIKLSASPNIKIIEAHLYYDDDSIVSDSNMANLNQNVNMLVQIERGGWKEKEEIVSIGASEKILTSTSKVVLDEPDLFETLKDISAEDAKYITLKAKITSQIKKFNYFLVTFTIWDKWGTGKITGSYKLHIR